MNKEQQDFIRNFVATESDISREFGSIDNLKARLKQRTFPLLEVMAETMIKTMQRIPPSIILLSKPHGQLEFKMLHLVIEPLMKNEITQRMIPDMLFHFIARDYAQHCEEDEKIYGLAFFSETWMSFAEAPIDAKEVVINDMPRNDPDRQEGVVIIADFPFGEAMRLMTIDRTIESDPKLDPMQKFGKWKFDDATLASEGNMSGLLRKLTGHYTGIKYPIRFKNQNPN